MPSYKKKASLFLQDEDLERMKKLCKATGLNQSLLVATLVKSAAKKINPELSPEANAELLEK